MKRRLPKLGVFLLLGAIVNVAVAWTLMWLSSTQQKGISVSELSEGLRFDHSFSGFGRDVQAAYFVPDTPMVLGLNKAGTIGVTSGPTCTMKWTHLAGWPRRSMTRTDTAQFVYPNRPSSMNPPFAIQLYTPIWPGFATNTILYAAILVLLFVAIWIAPGKIRRFVRLRGHRCPACGYKIADGVGSRCSECGALLPLPLGEGRGEGTRGKG